MKAKKRASAASKSESKPAKKLKKRRGETFVAQVCYKKIKLVLVFIANTLTTAVLQCVEVDTMKQSNVNDASTHTELNVQDASTQTCKCMCMHNFVCVCVCCLVPCANTGL